MGKISVEFLETGMELADDVCAPGGMVLLGAGATITERHIGIFKSWEVMLVDVVATGKDNEIAGKIDLLTDSDRAAIDKELDRMFQHNDPLDPVVEELRRICRQRELEKAAGML